jgi:hypothetical protein
LEFVNHKRSRKDNQDGIQTELDLDIEDNGVKFAKYQFLKNIYSTPRGDYLHENKIERKP